MSYRLDGDHKGRGKENGFYVAFHIMKFEAQKSRERQIQRFADLIKVLARPVDCDPGMSECRNQAHLGTSIPGDPALLDGDRQV